MTYTVRCKECDPDKEWDVNMSPYDKTPQCKQCKKRTQKVMQSISVTYNCDGFTGAQTEFDSQ